MPMPNETMTRLLPTATNMTTVVDNTIMARASGGGDAVLSQANPKTKILSVSPAKQKIHCSKVSVVL